MYCFCHSQGNRKVQQSLRLSERNFWVIFLDELITWFYCPVFVGSWTIHTLSKRSWSGCHTLKTGRGNRAKICWVAILADTHSDTSYSCLMQQDPKEAILKTECSLRISAGHYVLIGLPCLSHAQPLFASEYSLHVKRSQLVKMCSYVSSFLTEKGSSSSRICRKGQMVGPKVSQTLETVSKTLWRARRENDAGTLLISWQNTSW